ncbi:MAG TPA: hypothetical protein VK191_07065 [Symbiobacteriaceae bacterium]|nr:hypothetical protein [Symbiobacteriaceae bacterium]
MRRLGGGLLALLLLLLVALPAAAAVTGGAHLLGGHLSDEGWGALWLELKNDGRELKGDLIVQREANPGEIESVAFSVPLTLPAGGTKKVPLPFARSYNSGKITVRFEVEGKKVFETETLLADKEPGLYLVGLLTDDERGIAGLDGYKVLGNGANAVGQPLADARVEMARLDPEQFPTESSLLGVFDALVLYRYQTERLNPEQRDALASWVAAGGTLLIGGGPEWKATLSPLPAGLLPVSVTGVGTADLGALGTLAPGKGAPGAGPVSLATVTSGQILAEAGGVPLAVAKAYGAGRVLYLAADPGLAPLATWDGTGPFMASLLQIQPVLPWKDQGFRTQHMANPLQQMGALEIPPLSLLFGVLVLYVVIIGPLSYWLLKRRDRRELLWVSVPILALLFVGGAWLGSGGRRTGVLGSLITITELFPGTGSGRLSTFVGLYSPSGERLAVPVPADSLVRPLNEYDQTWRQGTINLSGQPTIELRNVTTYSLSSFALTKDVKLPEGLVLVDAKVEGNVLTGRLVNHLDQPVEGITLIRGGASTEIGAIAAGATSEPFSLDLSLVGRPNIPMEGWGSARTPAERLRNRKQQVLQSFLNGPDPTTKEQELLQVFAWLQKPLAGHGFTGAVKIEEGPHLLWQKLLLPVGKGGLR